MEKWWIILTENGLGYILGDFTPSHPVTLVRARVARFFLVQLTKTGENIPNDHKIYQMAVKHFQWS
jgi:hypothetical protein